MRMQNEVGNECGPAPLNTHARKYKKINGVELLKMKNYFSESDKLHLLERHGLDDKDYTIVKLKLVHKKSYSEIGKQYGLSNEWARQIFIRAITKLKSHYVF